MDFLLLNTNGTALAVPFKIYFNYIALFAIIYTNRYPLYFPFLLDMSNVSPTDQKEIRNLNNRECY